MKGVKFQKLLKAAQFARKDYLNLGKDIMKLDTLPSYQEMYGLVADLKKSDFNIQSDFFTKNNIVRYSSTLLFETDNNDICFGLFILPKGYYIPMHDHPGMWVVSKILHGTARKSSYSLTQKIQSKHQFLLPQQVKKIKEQNKSVDQIESPDINLVKQFDNVISEGLVDVVRPEVGNLHEFSASEDQDFIFFNCFVPHYDDVTKFTNYYDIEDRDAKFTTGKILTKPIPNYTKDLVSLDLEEMPFFSEEAPFNSSTNKLLSEFLQRENYQSKYESEQDFKQQKQQQQLQNQNRILKNNQYNKFHAPLQ
ncbi:RmlC-like cupin domain [Pseudocohnilembus persalinus]|uniref:RmlC-like cupin domain n=1 Tax=Pseudocohnilembus persalinus TaxID=266149 RepID=A0A0V0R7I2_PSEPJ|nr:RmlC-like cupin domain [Pseudocohnilembus persalinus]|eukprot:KRX10443.1 RmlC-like cupin domain [Pseudocohnilembus persalinus]